MQRTNGFYWVKLDGKWCVSEFEDGLWYHTGHEGYSYDDPIEIDETPITRPTQTRKLLSTAQTLATLKKTLADFPDTLLVTSVHIEMHNKYSIQITEFNAELNEPQKGN